MSTLELGHEFESRKPTCWEFKWKIQQVMKSLHQNLLKCKVDFDEIFIGGPEENKRRRIKGKRKIVVVALEKASEEVGRACAQLIENTSEEEFMPIFKSYIIGDSNVITDEWKGYSLLKDEYKQLVQILSDDGKNFPNLHTHVMNLNGWLRSIHHHCSKERLQGYLNEYHYRYNRQNHMDKISHNLI